MTGPGRGGMSRERFLAWARARGLPIESGDLDRLVIWPGPREHDLERRARRIERIADLGVALVVLGIALAVLL